MDGQTNKLDHIHKYFHSSSGPDRPMRIRINPRSGNVVGSPEDLADPRHQEDLLVERILAEMDRDEQHESTASMKRKREE